MRKILMLLIINFETNKMSIILFVIKSFNILNDEKLRLEYDFRQRNETSQAQINALRSDLENCLENLNDK